MSSRQASSSQRVRTNGIMTCRFGVCSRTRAQEFALEREQVRLANVAIAAAVADHRIRLDRLELGAALEIVELVGPEVDRPVHDGTGLERRRHAQQRGRHPIEELLRPAARQQRAGVHPAQGVADHELGAQEADPVDRLGGDALGFVGDREVDIQAGRDRLALPRARVPVRRWPARPCAAGRLRRRLPSAAVDRSRSSPSRRTSVALRLPTMQGTPNSRTDDRRVARHASAVGDESGRAPQHRHPVGARHRRDQYFARQQRTHLLRASGVCEPRHSTRPGDAPSPRTRT